MKMNDGIAFMLRRTKTTVAISSFLFLLSTLIADLNMGGVYSASGYSVTKMALGSLGIGLGFGLPCILYTNEKLSRPPASGSAGNPLHAPYRLCHRRSELPPAEEAGGQDQPGTGAEAQLNNSHSTGRKESADRRAPFLLRPVRAEYGISSEEARRENSIGREEHNLIC